jgi:hypothetical protein
MRFLNDYDIASARQRYGRGETPNRLALVMVIDNLREWTDQHSDGWAYWSKPCRSAAAAIALVESTAYPEYERRQHEDITDAEVVAAVKPIKAFLTRHKHLVTPEWREIILRACS